MSISKRCGWAAIATIALCVGCGSKVTGVDGGGGTGGNGTGGGGTGGSCAGFEDEAPKQEVTITVHNEGAAPIYLSGPGCSPFIELVVKDADGQPRPWQRDVCTFTCEDLRTESGVCAAGCALPPIIKIESMGSYELVWTGTVFDVTQMPISCFYDPQNAGAGECFVQVVAPGGSYTLSTSAWDAVSGCGGECTCTPDENGACQIEAGGFVEGTPRQGSTEVSYPSETAVDIVFEQ